MHNTIHPIKKSKRPRGICSSIIVVLHKKMSDTQNLTRIYMPRPKEQCDPRPEVWKLNDAAQFLCFYPYVVSSALVSHGRGDYGYEFRTRRSVYIVDWAPTIRTATLADVMRIRDCMKADMDARFRFNTRAVPTRCNARLM